MKMQLCPWNARVVIYTVQHVSNSGRGWGRGGLMGKSKHIFKAGYIIVLLIHNGSIELDVNYDRTFLICRLMTFADNVPTH